MILFTGGMITGIILITGVMFVASFFDDDDYH